jgi:hypothetical protein
MVTRTQTQNASAPWIRVLPETLETHLAEINHSGELKLQHPEPLACGSLLHATIHWNNKQATTPSLQNAEPPTPTQARPPPTDLTGHHPTTFLQAFQAAAHQLTKPQDLQPLPANLPQTHPLTRACETFSRPNKILYFWSHTWQKKIKEKEKKKQNSETLKPQSIKSFSMPHYTERTRGLQHHQRPALNLPRTHR